MTGLAKGLEILSLRKMAAKNDKISLRTLKGLRHEDYTILVQFCAKIII